MQELQKKCSQPVPAEPPHPEYTLERTMNDSTTDDLVRQAQYGDDAALGTLFSRYRDRLRKMVLLRLDRRLYGRLDASDVLQEAYLDVARRFPQYAAAPTVPVYLWLRALTGQRLT